MKQQPRTLKLRCKTGLYAFLLDGLAGIKVEGEVIPYPKVFSFICVRFSLPKKQAWELLFLLHDIGLVTLANGHGIKLNYSFEDEK